MKTYVVLLDVTSDDLYAWLHDCIEIAQNEATLLPSRPRPAAMLPCQVPLHQLYRFVREVVDWCVGIYESPPEISPPFGVPLLLLGRLRIATTRIDHVPICVWCYPTFPLDLIEVAWELAQRFPNIPAPPSSLEGFVRPSDLTGLRLCDGPVAFRSPSGTCHLSRSARVAPSTVCSAAPDGDDIRSNASNSMLPSTLWLMEQIAKQPEVFDPEPFYQEWAERYRNHTGLIPRDSSRSFEKAIESAFKQLGRTRPARR